MTRPTASTPDHPSAPARPGVPAARPVSRVQLRGAANDQDFHTALAGRPLQRLSPVAASRLRAARLGLAIVGLVALPYILWFNGDKPSILGFDAYTTWSIDLDHLYAGTYLDLGAFRYTPVYAQLFAWVNALPWEVFLGAWLGAIVLILWRWFGAWTLAVMGLAPVALELYHGNIHVFIAAAMVAGVRWPLLWLVPMLSKVTPGLAIAWFAGRGEWRKLTVALGATAAACGVSFLLAPDLWREFVAVNLGALTWRPETPFPVPIPFYLRAPLALALALYGGRRDWRWTIPVAGMIALPIIWWHGYSMLVAVVPTLRDDIARGTVRLPGRLRVLEGLIGVPRTDPAAQPEPRSVTR